MRRIYLLLLALLSTTLSAAETEQIAVPKGGHVLLDGRLEAGEWSDAKELEASPSVRVYLKRTEEYLYVAIKLVTPAAFGVDLYFDTKQLSLLNLHASAKLAEREGKFENWPEWKWWNNRDWAANVGRIEKFKEPSFLADEAKEFQISLKKLGRKTLWLSFDLQSTSEPERLPVDGLERHGRRWFNLNL